MGDKILVEFDEERIKEWCKLQKISTGAFPCSVCKSVKEQLKCMLMEGSLYIERDYKIKEQNNDTKTSR